MVAELFGQTGFSCSEVILGANLLNDIRKTPFPISINLAYSPNSKVLMELQPLQLEN